MVNAIAQSSKICVIGRTEFNSGIGAITYAACELLSRHFPVTIYPTDKKDLDNFETIILPNGKIIEVCKNLQNQKVFFYTDVLWNGEFDSNYKLIPDHGLRIAHVSYDSDEFPPKWVQILNNKFDLALFSIKYLESVAIKSGVNIAVGTLPIALDLHPLLLKPLKRQHHPKIRFGSIAAFHTRKGINVLAEAFFNQFNHNPNVELIIHSNLASDETYNEIISFIHKKKASNIICTFKNFENDQKLELLNSIDIFVNCSRGEGYSIGPREALALGKVIVVSNIEAHKDLKNAPGVFFITPTVTLEASYPEIDNQIFGKQHAVEVDNIKNTLCEALTFYQSEECNSTVRLRKKLAAEFSFSALSTHYAEVINPQIYQFRKNKVISKFANISAEIKKIALEKVGNYCEFLQFKNRVVVPAHDAGFFSVFNIFISNLVWELFNDKCHMILPDWDVARLIKKEAPKKLMSFCYGQPKDGNIWAQLFEPLYGLTAEQMNDETFLYQNSTLPAANYNENREPLLTNINAYGLYKSPSFKNFRKQYHQVYKDHIKLLPHFQQEIDEFSKKHFTQKFMIAAHIKHPSHIIEQPDKSIARTAAYIKAILHQLAAKNIAYDSPDWGIFLATDQNRVVQQMKEKFGEKVYYFPDARRTSVEEDDFFESLSPAEQAKEGYQVQHLVASTPENYSTRMAWEVIRDAMLMAKCNLLLHVVSNVSTAVSYFNPEIELVFCE